MYLLRVVDAHGRINRHKSPLDITQGLDFPDLRKCFNGFIPITPTKSHNITNFKRIHVMSAAKSTCVCLAVSGCDPSRKAPPVCQS